MATYARTALRLPKPSRAALPFLVLCAAALGLQADRRLWIVAAAAAAFFAAAGAARALAAQRELARLRRTADRLILHTSRFDQLDAVAQWRSEELTAPRERAAMRREVERLLRELAPQRLPSASPLRRPAARQHADLLRRLADRLDDDRPVAVRGVVLAQRLLRDATSPLYNEDAEYLLPRALARVLGALEP